MVRPNFFAGEKVRPDHSLPAPEIQTVLSSADYQVITLDKLLLMKLLSNRRKDQVHVDDLIGIGLVYQKLVFGRRPDAEAKAAAPAKPLSARSYEHSSTSSINCSSDS